MELTYMVQAILISLFILIIISLLITMYIDNHYHSKFLNGFWKTAEGENDILIYFDIKEKNANVIISRNGKTLSDKKYMIDIDEINNYSISNTIYRPQSVDFNISFDLDDDQEIDPYDKLFIGELYKATIVLNQGTCILETNDISMTLVKDNLMNYKFLKYLLN